MSNIELIVDVREPEWFKEMVKGMGEKYSTPELLKVGDLKIITPKSTMYIERKEYKDFINSSLNNRLYEQACRLSVKQQEGARVLVLVEGLPEYNTKVMQLKWLNDSRKRTNYFHGIINALVYRYGIPALYVQAKLKKGYGIGEIDRENLSSFLYATITREKKGTNDRLPEMQFTRIPKFKYNDDVRIRMLQVIPGISAKTSGELLGRFDTMKELVNAEPEDYIMPKKIGKKRSEAIYNTWNESTKVVIKRGK